MLLNEFLKEHREVEQQQATIGRLETTAAKQETNIAELKFNVSPSTPMTCLAHQRTLANKTTTLDGRNVNMASITNMDVAVSLAHTPQRLAKPRVLG